MAATSCSVAESYQAVADLLGTFSAFDDKITNRSITSPFLTLTASSLPGEDSKSKNLLIERLNILQYNSRLTDDSHQYRYRAQMMILLLHPYHHCMKK